MTTTVPKQSPVYRSKREIKTFTLDVVAAGKSGAATGNASSSPIGGFFLGFKVPASVPSGTKWKLEGATSAVIYYNAVVNAVEGWVFPRMGVITNAGGAITDSFEMYPVLNEAIKVTVSESNAGTLIPTIAFVEA